MSSLRCRFLSLAGIVLAVLAGRASAQQVYVLAQAAGPGVDFTSFNQAVAAVPAGSILLVRQGDYNGGVLDGMGLSIIAEAGATPTLNVNVRNLPADQWAVIVGMRMTGAAMSMHDNLGHVRFERCTMLYPGPEFTGANLTLTHCADVTMVNCTIKGRDFGLNSSLNPVPATIALEIEDSSVSLAGCTITGGSGQSPQTLIKLVGATGAVMHSGFLLVTGSTIVGGAGGNGGTVPPFGDCVSPKNGGTGLQLTQGNPAVVLIDGHLVGGAAGIQVGLCSPAANGAPSVVATGTITQLPGIPPTLASNSPVREGQSATVTLGAAPGSVALLALGIRPDFHYAAGLHGVLGVLQPVIVGLGTVPAGGSIALAGTVPDLGPALEGLVVQLQAVTSGGGPGTTVLGQTVALVLLDSSL